MSTIVLPGLTVNDPVPGSYINVGFAQGQSAGASAVRDILIIARKGSAGSAVVDSMIYGPTSQPSLTTDADADALLQSGSPAHRMWREVVRVNPSANVYVVCPADAPGAKATGTIVLSGTASKAGTLRVYIDEETIDISVAKDATAASVATLLEPAINAKKHLGVTASVSGATVTLTDKVAGEQAHFSKFKAALFEVTGLTVTPTTATRLSGGDVTDVSYANVLATIKPHRFYYIVSEQSAAYGASDGSNSSLAALMAQVDEMALPINGIRQRVFVGSTDTQANTIASAINTNHARCEIIWAPDSDRRPEQVAAAAVGVYSYEEAQAEPRANFSGYGSDAATARNWNLKAPLSGRALTRAEIVAALNNGVTPIAVGARGITYIVKRITSYCRNGVLSDFRIRDAHKVTYADFFADDWDALVSQQFTGKKIGNDPVVGQRSPGPDVVTPAIFRSALIGLLRVHEAKDRIENVEQTIASLVVQRETTPTTRLSARAQVDFIDVADQFATDIAQVA